MQERKNFYLVFKEAINNIAKYAGCSDVWIEMTLKNKQVILSIRDNGKGFDPEIARKGNGLINMRTRAEQLKGTLNIDTVPGEGTTIRFSFPV
jgi:signal transduction histidine kinase